MDARPAMEATPRQAAWAMSVEAAVNRLAGFIVRHWLLVLNLGCALLIVPMLLVPYIASLGESDLSRFLYLIYRPTCHQIPSRCLTLFGQPLPVCARCFSTYAAFWGIGMLYGLWRALPWSERRGLPSVSVSVVLLLCVPLGIDGLTQFVGLRESTNLLRVITGGLMGGGFALFALPHLERGFQEASIQPDF